MANYLLTYHGPDGMAQSEAEIAAAMDEWGRWFGELGDAVVDGGKPAAATKVLSSDGTVADGGPAAPTGYTVLRADSHDAAVALARGRAGPAPPGSLYDVAVVRPVRQRGRLGPSPMNATAESAMHADRPAPAPAPAPFDLAALRASVRGPVIAPGDPGYDDARRIMYGGERHRPAAIVRVADAADVATAIGIARRTGLELAVRSGGHSGAEHSTTDGGIVIDVRDLRDLEIDAEGRTAWAGTGLTAGEYTAAAVEHGLATGFGDTGSVGLGGIVTGGGVGYLVRRHGLTIDSLLAAEVVTADGRILAVDDAHHPDLFWAIRGGGGNFGVLTRVRLRLHPVAPFTGGILLLPATADVVAGFMAAAEAAPEELSAIANVMPAPPMPFLAPEHHGTMCVFAMVAYVGDDEAARRALEPFRALATPLADMVEPSSYAAMFPPDDPDYHPEAVAQTLFMDRVGLVEAALIMDRLAASDADMRVAQLRVLGGASARVPAKATAYAHRKRLVMVNLAAFYAGEEERARRQAWVDAFADALRGADRAAYVNFLGDEGPDRVRDAYPGATWDRLVEVKRRYDPDNLFRRNQNIPPGDAAAG